MQPTAGARDRAARVMQQHEAAGGGGQKLGRTTLQRVGLRVAGMHADREHDVGLADRLFRPCGQLVIGDVDDEFGLSFQIVDGMGRRI